jgi:hypothetical protein
MRLLLLLTLAFQPIRAFHNPTGRLSSRVDRTIQQPTKTIVTSKNVPISLVTLRGGGGGGGGGSELAELAYAWCMNLGQPAALVAGAVVATIYENIRGAELEVRPDDVNYAKHAKRGTTFLLMTAFALQIICIFVTTVTGTMLLSRTPFENTMLPTALGYLREHFEFEYLTCRITFLQGLLNWLGAVALEHTIHREGEGKAAVKMNNFIASSILTLIVLLISFYNNHMTFYHNYLHMLWRWTHLTFVRYVGHWPPRPLAFAYVPSTIITCVLLVEAIRNKPSKQKK